MYSRWFFYSLSFAFDFLIFSLAAHLITSNRLDSLEAQTESWRENETLFKNKWIVMYHFVVFATFRTPFSLLSYFIGKLLDIVLCWSGIRHVNLSTWVIIPEKTNPSTSLVRNLFAISLRWAKSNRNVYAVFQHSTPLTWKSVRWLRCWL